MRIYQKSGMVLLICLVILSCNTGDKVDSTTEAAATENSAELQQSPAPAYQEITQPQVEVDIDSIKTRGRLIALTGYSSSSYFVYKGQPMGYEYEMLQLLADYLDLDLDIVIVRNLDRIFSMLNEGRGDILAYNMTVTKERQKKVRFTNHHTLIHQVLIQRMPDNWRDMKRHQIERQLLQNATELIGKKVHVRKGSSYYHRLQHLSDEIGGDIDIVEVPGNVSTESLIAQVANGEIDYTVADENVAQVNAAYHQNLDIRIPISLPQRIAWAVRNNSPEMLNMINEWLTRLKWEPTFNVLYDKYHRNKRFFKQRVRSDFFSLTGDRISPYDDLIKKYSQGLKWDWRLLASQVYQESEFDPRAQSWAGARGLLQLMPPTARQFGAKKLYDPEDNISAGTRYLKWLWRYWKTIPDSLERMKFVLGSYNAGQGHVEDARKLAKKLNKNPNIWDDNVAECLLKKADQKYYNDEVVRYGYCRGEEPVNYVRDILDRFGHYQKFVKL